MDLNLGGKAALVHRRQPRHRRQHDGVRVNAINPRRLIETERFGRNIERVSREHGFDREQAIAFLLSSHGTTRVGRPEEIGWLTAYLASEKSDFIQGCVIDIDGGATRSL